MASIYFQEPSTDGAPGIWDLNDAVRFQAIGRWPALTPPALFAAGRRGCLFDVNDLTALFQNTSGTIPSLPGDPVGLMLDKSGNSRHLSQPTTAARPILARMPLTGRRNLLTNTGLGNNLDTSGGDLEYTSIDGFPRAALFKLPSANTTYGYLNPPSASLIVGQTYTLSVFVETSDGLPPMFASSTHTAVANDFHLIVVRQPTDPLEYVVEEVRPGLFRVSGTAVRMDDGTPNCGVSRSVSQATKVGARQFKVTGYQLELGTEPTPYQKVTNAFDVTEAGVPDVYSLVYDLVDDALTTTLPQAINGDLLIAGTKGSIIEPVNYAAGSTFTLGPDTYTGGTPGILRAIGDIVGVLVIDRTLSAAERENLIDYYKGKGAKGLLVPGPDVAWADGSLSVSDFLPNEHFQLDDEGDEIRITRLVTSGSSRLILDTRPVTVGQNEVKFSITELSSSTNGFYTATQGGSTSVFSNSYPNIPIDFHGVYKLTGMGNGRLRFNFNPCRGANPSVGEIGDYMKLSKVISVRELRAQEDWL